MYFLYQVGFFIFATKSKKSQLHVTRLDLDSSSLVCWFSFCDAEQFLGLDDCSAPNWTWDDSLALPSNIVIWSKNWTKWRLCWNMIIAVHGLLSGEPVVAFWPRDGESLYHTQEQPHLLAGWIHNNICDMWDICNICDMWDII